MKVVSTDVFDTLLLRDIASERRRLREIAFLCAAKLDERGFVVSAERIARTRLFLLASAYRAVNVGRVGGDFTLGDLARSQARLLGIADTSASAFVASELEVEAKHLRVNRKLASLLEAAARSGKRVIGISDTHVDKDSLSALIRAIAPATLLHAIYVSSDLDQTKKSAGLFRHVLRSEGVSPDQLLHIGDDKWSDWEMGIKCGIRVVHRPRSICFRALRKIDAGWNRMRGFNRWGRYDRY